MIYKRFAILSLLFIFFNLSSIHAQTYYGCVSNDTGLIYPNNVYGSTYEPTNPQTAGVGNYCGPKYQGNCRIRSRTKCSGCGNAVNEAEWWQRPDWWYYQAGNEYLFVPCPIDDYVPFIIFAIGGAGFIFIRNRSFLVS